MSPRLSVQLDALRLAAALAVLMGHVSTWLLPALGAIAGHHAQEAVSVFFVLSGFVIAYSSDREALGLRDYVAARAARLYSVVLPVLLIALTADAIGRHLDPQWYAAQSFVGGPPTMLNLLLLLGFGNALWFHDVVIGTGSAFWSLGFEVPYYALFAILSFARGRTRTALVLGWAALVGPRILLYLPLWLLGLATWRIVRQRPALPRMLAVAMLILALPLYAWWKTNLGGPSLPQFIWQSTPQALYYALYHLGVGAITAAAIVAAAALADGRPAYSRAIVAPVRWLAGASFTLYLLHLPLIMLGSALLPRDAGLAARLMVLAGVLAAILLAAEVGERRKRQFAQLAGSLWVAMRAHLAMAGRQTA